MTNWIDKFGYRLAQRFQWRFAPLWYRWRCPYPILDDHSVRACIAADCCGCDNDPRNARTRT
jgi:hypothetical protein